MTTTMILAPSGRALRNFLWRSPPTYCPTRGRRTRPGNGRSGCWLALQTNSRGMFEYTNHASPRETQAQRSSVQTPRGGTLQLATPTCISRQSIGNSSREEPSCAWTRRRCFGLRSLAAMQRSMLDWRPVAGTKKPAREAGSPSLSRRGSLCTIATKVGAWSLRWCRWTPILSAGK